MTDHLTLTVVVVIIAVGIVFDVWTLVRRGYRSTISWQVMTLSRKQLIIPFVFGIVAGHLFWSNRAAEDDCQKTEVMQP